MSQLELFTDPPVTAVTVCNDCDAAWAIPVEPGETWGPAMLWGYIELRSHQRTMHPKERTDE